MQRLFFLFFLLLGSALSAGSVRLYNDSSYKLRAVIRSADGAYLGEMVILPQHFNTWTNSFNEFGPYGGKAGGEEPTRAQTPYSVQWYCLDGGEYSLNTNVATGSLAAAQQGAGSRHCKPKKKKKSPSQSADDEVLHDQNEACCPCPSEKK